MRASDRADRSFPLLIARRQFHSERERQLPIAGLFYGRNLALGQTVVLWFNDHDDGYAGDPTYFLLDDVALN